MIRKISVRRNEMAAKVYDLYCDREEIDTSFADELLAHPKMKDAFPAAAMRRHLVVILKNKLNVSKQSVDRHRQVLEIYKTYIL